MKLNKGQRLAVFGGLVAAVMMGPFPPWEQHILEPFPHPSMWKMGTEALDMVHGNADIEQGWAGVVLLHGTAGYHFIGRDRPPKNFRGKGRFLLGVQTAVGWRMDAKRLFAQWFTVAFATAAAVILLGPVGTSKGARDER